MGWGQIFGEQVLIVASGKWVVWIQDSVFEVVRFHKMSPPCSLPPYPLPLLKHITGVLLCQSMDSWTGARVFTAKYSKENLTKNHNKITQVFPKGPNVKKKITTALSSAEDASTFLFSLYNQP